MASFYRQNLPSIYGYQDFVFYSVDGKITEEDIATINHSSQKIVLVLPNTKGQDTAVIRKIHNPNVLISVAGGLNYLQKKKFQEKNYIDRTIHSPNELASIIGCFEKIEQGIRYTWTDRQKCMYVYKTLVEQLHYKYDHESDYEDGRDIVRSLEGLLYGRLVCSGFAIAFKEAMDRLGIPCEYQNQAHSHSWNVVQLDGKNYGMDVTWDCGEKDASNTCFFRHFGRSATFYEESRWHDITQESEEVQYPLSAFAKEELSKDLSAIKHGKIHERREMHPVQDSNEKIYFSILGEENKVYTYIIYLYGTSHVIYSDKSPKDLCSLDVFHAIENQGYDTGKSPQKPSNPLIPYCRDDKSTFFIQKARDVSDSMGEYYYFEVRDGNGIPVVHRAALLSETDLSYPSDSATRSQIANQLLNPSRLAKKINHYHGYVGYLSQNHMYYDYEFEEENLHVMQHI